MLAVNSGICSCLTWHADYHAQYFQFFRLSSLWLSSVLGLKQTRLFILFAHFCLCSVCTAFVESVSGGGACGGTFPCEDYAMPAKKIPSIRPLPSPSIHPYLHNPTAIHCYPAPHAAHAHAHRAHRRRNGPPPSPMPPREGPTDGWTLLCFFLGSLPAVPSASLLLSSRSGGQMDHLRASFAYHHRCIPQLLKEQRRLLGAIILAVSFLRFVRASAK